MENKLTDILLEIITKPEYIFTLYEDINNTRIIWEIFNDWYYKHWEYKWLTCNSIWLNNDIIILLDEINWFNIKLISTDFKLTHYQIDWKTIIWENEFFKI